MAIKFFNVGMQQANEPPVAALSPASQRSVVGAVIRVDGRSSYDPEGAALTYTWSFTQVPIGSELDNTSFRLQDGGEAATFVPDVAGTYVVRLVVNDGQFDSNPAEALTSIGLVQTPVCTDIVPDGRFFFRVISDFWRLVEDKEMLPIFWSAYLQTAASVLLELLQADYDKSIETALEQKQRRWLPYNPRLDLTDTFVLYGNEQDGVSASTGAVGEPLVLYLLSDSEVGVLKGSVKSSSAGKTLEILTAGPNAGEYILSGTGPANRSYLLSPASLLPSPAAGLLASGTDMTVVSGSSLAESATVDFAAAGTVPGDVLFLSSGAQAGAYEVVAVGLVGGLPNDRTVQVSAVWTASEIVGFRAYRAMSSIIQPNEESPLSDVVSFPSTEGDLTALETLPLSGVGRVLGSTEIEVGAAYVFDAAVGNSIELAGGVNPGRYTIVAVSDSREGYIIGGSLSGPFPQEDTPFSMNPIGKAQGRVILINGQTYTLLRARADENQPEPPLGPGPLQIGVLDAKSLVAGLTSAEWRVPSTLVASIDLEAAGVRAGDTLVFAITNLDNGRQSEVHTTVVGTDGPRVGFEVTLSEVTPGATLELSDEAKVSLAEDLGIDGAYIDPVSGSLVLEGTALEVDTSLRSLAFARRYHNLPVRETSSIEAGGVLFQVRADRVIRNCMIPVDERTVSIPCLREYVVPPVVAQDPDTGALALVTRDGVQRETDRLPVSLEENADFIVDSETSIRGRDGQITAGSAVFTSPAGFFRSRNVDIGDSLRLSGQLYEIVQVVSEQELQAVSSLTGEPFAFTDTSLVYEIVRKTLGKFIRFVPGTFTPALPAPDTLRAETTFITNDDIIEDNFGLMVSLTQDDLSERATSSTTYREAVLGLMYAWANGPKVLNLRLGAQILLGLPVADQAGIIRSITDDFRVDPVTGESLLGRIFVEDTDEDGNPTGIVRLYFYPPLLPSSLEDFAGLEVNPATGRLYEVGDTVERFAPLSKGVQVRDYVNYPDWWRGRLLQGDVAAELRKYHTWSLRVSADVINEEDFELVSEFGKALDPAWVDLEGGAVLVKPMSDDIEIQDDLLLDVREIMRDDPFGSIEATAVVGDNNGSGYALQHVGAPPMWSRLLFAGDDLKTPAGGAGPLLLDTPRGGLVNPLSAPPHPGYGVAPADHGAWVTDADLLFIPEGPNAGWYCITLVASDNQFWVNDISALAGYLDPEDPMPALQGPSVTGMQVAEGQSFFIFRLVTHVLVQGNNLDTTAGGGVATSPTGSWVTRGVTVDDSVIIFSGPARGRYQVAEILGSAYPYNDMRLFPAPASDSNIDFAVVRESLRGNPLLVCGAATTVAASPLVAVSRTDVDLQDIRTYDELVIEDGPDAGTYQVLDVTGVGQVYVRPAPANGGVSTASYLQRPGLTDRSGMQLGRVARFFPADAIALTLMRPRTVIHASGAAEATASGSEFLSGVTNFTGLGVVGGDFLEVGAPVSLPTDVNTGVYLIDSVVSAGFGLDVTSHLQTSAVPVYIRVLRDDPAGFTVAGNVVTAATAGFQDVGVVPGDVFDILSGVLAGTYVVAEVTSNTQLLLTTSPGAGVVAGRIRRIVR